MAGERVDAEKVAAVLKDEVIICQSCSTIVTNPVLYYNEDLIMQYQSAVNMEAKTIDVDGGSSEQWDSYNIELAYIECEHCGKEIDVPDDFDFDWVWRKYLNTRST